MSEPTKTRYWLSWYGGKDSDPRPVTFPVPVEWWCTGEDLEGVCTICAIVDAESEADAFCLISQWWPEAKARFCKEQEPGWRPTADRFPPKSAQVAGAGTPK